MPYIKEESASDSEQLLTNFVFDGIKSISFKNTVVANRNSFTSFAIEYHRVGDLDNEFFTERSK